MRGREYGERHHDGVAAEDGFSGNSRLFTEPEKKKVFGKIGVHNAVVGILP